VTLACQGLGPLRIAVRDRAAATVQGDDGRGADWAGGADQGAIEHDPAWLGDADVLNTEGGVVKQGEQCQKLSAQRSAFCAQAIFPLRRVATRPASSLVESASNSTSLSDSSTVQTERRR